MVKPKDKKDEKEKRKYELDDVILKEKMFTSDIKARVIRNKNGYFFDLRRWYNNFPTKKGLRMGIADFIKAAAYLTEAAEEFKNEWETKTSGESSTKNNK